MFESLPGFRDFYPDDCARRNYLFRVWSQTALRAGFLEYDIPTLEPLELLTTKSGPEIVSQLFNFTDKGGREVALRPELTPSLARMVGTHANALKRPIKWFNIAENFRYEKPQKGRTRSHYQFNCDIFGESGPGADAELMATCIESLRALGLGEGEFILRLSDRGLWMEYLALLGISDDRALAVLGVVDKLERLEREEAIALLKATLGEAAADFLGQVETLIGLRNLDELNAFFTQSVFDGKDREPLQKRLEAFGELIARLEALDVASYVRIDFGIVRGLAYYTGFVFEVFELSSRGTTGRALAGGGRYDHLVGKLGYPELPAVGFGMGDVTMMDLLMKKKRIPALAQNPDIYAVFGDDEPMHVAMRDVARLRRIGLNVQYSLKSLGFGKQFKLAGQSGATLALIYGSDEIASGLVRVKDPRSGKEATILSGGLEGQIQEILAEGIHFPEEGVSH